uniref:Uncharacterized protein n=1 Tax=Faecalibaculum rodentium TaxID=1702221 RepID=A0A140DSA8_9FIRM|nr:hypothetical protein AALO17_04010 [Faecalibaculum rodentium]
MCLLFHIQTGGSTLSQVKAAGCCPGTVFRDTRKGRFL